MRCVTGAGAAPAAPSQRAAAAADLGASLFNSNSSSYQPRSNAVQQPVVHSLLRYQCERCEAVFISCPSRVPETLGRAYIRCDAAASNWSQAAANRVERRRVLTVEVGDSRVGATAVLARRALRAALRGTTGSSTAAAAGAVEGKMDRGASLSAEHPDNASTGYKQAEMIGCMAGCLKKRHWELALGLTRGSTGALAALAGGHHRGHAILLCLGNHRSCHTLLPPARRPAAGNSQRRQRHCHHMQF